MTITLFLLEKSWYPSYQRDFRKRNDNHTVFTNSSITKTSVFDKYKKAIVYLIPHNSFMRIIKHSLIQRAELKKWEEPLHTDPTQQSPSKGGIQKFGTFGGTGGRHPKTTTSRTASRGWQTHTVFPYWWWRFHPQDLDDEALLCSQSLHRRKDIQL